MQLIESIQVFSPAGQRTIEFYGGDLAALPPDHAVDVLVVSAFPSDYSPTPSSLIGELYQNGVNVGQLALAKAEDLRMDFGCWLSEVVPDASFRRILCFEPMTRGEAPEVVADVFRCLAAIGSPSLPIRSVAMPILATGDQGYSPRRMLKRILECAVQWMSSDLPLERLKIVSHKRKLLGRLQQVFVETKSKLRNRQSDRMPQASSQGWDVLVSAAPEDHQAASLATEVMSTVVPGLRIYRAAQSRRNIGGMLQQHYEAIDGCKRVMALLTPQYLSSHSCQDDLCIARFRSHSSDTPVLFPVYLRSARLPPSVRVLRMVDCREEELSALRIAAALLAIQLIGVRAYRGADALGSSQEAAPLRAMGVNELFGVPVLGPMRLHNDLGVPGSISREAALLDFCISAFTTDEFRILLRHCPNGQETVESLPDPAGTPMIVYADKAIEYLVKRRMVDVSLFSRIKSLRPRRAAEVQQLEELW